MKRTRTEAAVALFLGASVLFSFFMPWFSVELKGRGTINSILGNTDKAGLVMIRGFDIPRLANSEDARSMQAVFEVFSHEVENADKKSYLVWLVPLFALLAGGLTFPARTRKWLAATLAGLCIFLAVAGCIKILSADLKGLLYVIRIIPTMWWILSAYFVIALINIHLLVDTEPISSQSS